jgi:putative serine protease PepD
MSRRALFFALGGAVLVALIGGVVGGVVVKETWTSGSGSTTASGQAAACPAATVADDALPSVVTVQARSGQQGGSGSGVVIRSGGYVLTNDHVIAVASDGGTISIVRSDGETTGATLVGRDPVTDLAVIKAEQTESLPPISLGESGSLEVGQPVVALGSPLGLNSSVTAGIVSALNRYVRVPSETGQTAHLVNAIQTDAAINPGNSGGALVDCSANLVGINTAGAAVPNSPGGSIGLGFAIPIDLAKGIADELIANGKVSHLSIGVQLQQISPELAQQAGVSQGLYVTAVTSGGPADEAGLRPGDIILEVDGDPATIDALTVKTLTLKAGDTIQLSYERAGTKHTTTLTLAAGG